MRILGIDPGLRTIGLGLIEVSPKNACSAVEWLTIETPEKTPLAARLFELFEDLTAYLVEAKPDLVVVEQLFFSTNRRTALDVGKARGAILLAVSKAHIPLLEPNPLELKVGITGDGHADKRQMQDMMMRILQLQEIPKPDDAADALGLAVFGALTRKYQEVISHELRVTSNEKLIKKSTSVPRAS